ncbi:hypothetical protein HUW46_02290 [Amycolatopsis sp. CA-230715]|nr:hypothetical protein HUW46_02290 [Amycolatopsis sp. CA-230715]
MSEISTRRKALYFAAMLANVAVDLLLPTVVLLALAPTEMPAALRLAIGGTLLAGKAIGGRVESGEFRWRLALVAALVPTAVIAGCYLAGFGDVPSMVAGAVVSGAIVLGDLVRTRGGRRIDGFAVLVLLEVVASVVLTSISGDARFVLARTSLYLGIGGVFALATTWSERPLMRTALKPVAAKGDPARADAFDRTWRKSARFRGYYRAMTAGLGAVFLIDAVLRIVLVYSRPADEVVQSSLVSQLSLPVLLVLWFAAGRGLAVPRAERLLDEELAREPVAP